jgi:hypothetical protein
VSLWRGRMVRKATSDVSKAAVSGAAHELLARRTAHVDEALVIAALEIDLRLHHQAVVDDGLEDPATFRLSTTSGCQETWTRAPPTTRPAVLWRSGREAVSFTAKFADRRRITSEVQGHAGSDPAPL